MIGRQGNLFEQTDVDAICITTNGVTRSRDGAAVMGRGCAAEAVRRWPSVQYLLGHQIRARGNVLHLLTGDYGFNKVPMLWDEDVIGGVPDADGIVTPWHVVAFPVKHHWKEQADLMLIGRSAYELAALADARGWKSVALVRPGTGNGRLSWDAVRLVIEPILDDRFVIIQR